MREKRTDPRKFPVLFALFFCFCFLTVGNAASNKEIKASKERISGNQERLAEIKNEQEVLKTRLEELNGLKSDTAAYIAGLDKRQEELSAAIEARSASIGELEKTTAELERELSSLNGEVDRQKKDMAARIRYMYETSVTGSAEQILQSGSLSDMLNQTEYFRRISEYDREKLEEFKDAVGACREKQEELDSELAVMNAEKDSMEEQLAAVSQLEQEKTAELKAFEERISSANAESKALEADAGRLQAAIKEEEKKIAEIESELKRQEEEERKRAKAQNRKAALKEIGEYDFLWPVPSSSKVTSVFGEREAPVEGASTTHKGIDIGAAAGSEVLASESGTVVIAAYSESAGNYVMISHGNGIYTVYMHLKEIRAELNASVKRGDVIGTVGSTGYSTGPHLHFGLRVSGDYRNPENYVSP